MGLCLSTQAAPELSLSDFEAACRKRGLDGGELLLSPNDDIDGLLERVREARARVAGLRVEALGARTAEVLAKASAKLGAPVSLAPGLVALSALPAWADAFKKQGGRLLLSAGTNLDAMSALSIAVRKLETSAVGIAWEVRPSAESLSDASAVLFAAIEFLGMVRLHGGGPEQKEQEGLGLGGLFTDLALSGYTGAIVLTPSHPEKLPRWAKWLASQKSAGCGSAVEESVSKLLLDVRDVEPRDRLDTILGAYKSLERGGMMELTVDHDPSCMYHTLNATEPEGSFAFRKTEDGPEVWRAEVTKL